MWVMTRPLGCRNTGLRCRASKCPRSPHVSRFCSLKAALLGRGGNVEICPGLNIHANAAWHCARVLVISPHQMTRLRSMLALALCALAIPGALHAQQQPEWEMEALTDQGWAEFDFQTGLGRGTNGEKGRKKRDVFSLSPLAGAQ